MNRRRGRWAFGRIDTAAALADLERRPVNFDDHEVSPEGWNFDTHRTHLATEEPGPPEVGGPWERACRLAEDYEFSPPRIVRAVYDAAAPLEDRDMLLEGRFYALHFYFGVRVTGVFDERRDNGDRAWGWAYETLHGHLERGRMTYEVIKRHDSGRVEFVTNGYSQGAPTLNRLERLGWRLFGRWMQGRFYRSLGPRMRAHLQTPPPSTASTATADGPRLRLAPSDVKPRLLDRIAVHRLDPG